MAPLIPVRMCVDLDQLLVVDEVETSKIKDIDVKRKKVDYKTVIECV